MASQMHEKVIEALIEQGGSKKDLKFFDKKAAWKTAEEIIRLSKKPKDSHIISGVYPLNNILDNLGSFYKTAPCFLKKEMNFNVECNPFPKDIHLIKCEPAFIDATLKEIDDRGFVSVPTPYLLGLGVNHYGLLKDDYGSIISLDTENIMRDDSNNKSFIYLNLYGKRKLYLAKYNGKFTEDWWFAIFEKK